MRPWVVAAVAFLLASFGSASADHIDLTGLEELIGQDLIPAVTAPQFDDPDYVSDGDVVIGVSDPATNEATAYPVKVLVWHEIINDVTGGTPIAVTYCPLCRSGIVYERPTMPSGEPLTFRVSGYVYRNNLVMYDVQTFSLWPQILGQAINGSWHGTRLTVVSATAETWLEWRTAHPNTRLLARPHPEVCFPDGTCLEGGINYERDPYEGYYYVNRTFKDRVFPDDRLHPKALVLGLEVSGREVAYPFSALRDVRVVNDVLGGAAVAITYQNDSAQAFLRGARTFSWRDARTIVDGDGNAFDAVTGEGPAGRLERLPALVAFWFAWKDHHPATRVYGIDWPVSPSTDLRLPGAVVGGLLTAGVGVAAARRRRTA
ncbi:MAG: DUF3179 domain-containing protein [Euryarchaeota archaeon]|nr:DUF3179 domain-containing protein [Euryarchaeota archaeon]